MLTAKSISKAYGPKLALDGISFTLERGELVGLIGQNGAGKTTLLNILAGRLAPSHGSALVDGHDTLWEPETTKPLIGYMPEKPGLYDEMTVGALLRFACRLKGVVPEDIEPHLKELAGRTGIADALNRRVGHLSKGYRQRVGLAAALAGNPEVILLDEPTSGLDPVQIKEFRDLLRDLARDRPVILSTPILRDLDGLCGRALMLSQGRLVRDLRLTEDAARERTLRADLAMGREAAERLLNRLASVSRVQLLPPDTPGITPALLTGAPDAPMERELFRALVNADAALTRLSPVKSELEEIFLTAVTGRTPEEGTE